VLLSGPTGCGKSTVIRATAALLNMHYILVNIEYHIGNAHFASDTEMNASLINNAL
jgi:MoxR-like ATPase